MRVKCSSNINVTRMMPAGCVAARTRLFTGACGISGYGSVHGLSGEAGTFDKLGIFAVMLLDGFSQMQRRLRRSASQTMQLFCGVHSTGLFFCHHVEAEAAGCEKDDTGVAEEC